MSAFDEEIKELNPVMIISPLDRIQKTIFDALKALIHNNLSGIYVTLSRPYNILDRSLREANIDTNNLFFIDCISRSTINLKEESKVTYVTSEVDLSNLGIVIMKAMKSKNKNFILIDNIDALLIYNIIDEIAMFVQSLVKKADEYGLKLIVLTSGNDMKMRSKISLYFNKTIEIK